jgi:hypothetical protein
LNLIGAVVITAFVVLVLPRIFDLLVSEVH